MLITLLVHTRAHRAAVLRKRCSCSSDVQRCCAFSARCCAFSTGGEEQMHCRARGKHAAPGHRVDMSSRLPPYFTQIKSNIPPPTAYAVGHGRHLCCTPHIDIIFRRFLIDGFMLRRHLQKMHRPHEYFTFRNDSVSRTLDLAKYVVGPYQKQTFSKKLGTEVRGRTPKSPQGIQKSHFCFLVALETLCSPHISSQAYTVQ